MALSTVACSECIDGSYYWKGKLYVPPNAATTMSASSRLLSHICRQLSFPPPPPPPPHLSSVLCYPLTFNFTLSSPLFYRYALILTFFLRSRLQSGAFIKHLRSSYDAWIDLGDYVSKWSDRVIYIYARFATAVELAILIIKQVNTQSKEAKEIRGLLNKFDGKNRDQRSDDDEKKDHEAECNTTLVLSSKEVKYIIGDISVLEKTPASTLMFQGCSVRSPPTSVRLSDLEHAIALRGKWQNLEAAVKIILSHMDSERKPTGSVARSFQGSNPTFSSPDFVDTPAVKGGYAVPSGQRGDPNADGLFPEVDAFDGGDFKYKLNSSYFQDTQQHPQYAYGLQKQQAQQRGDIGFPYDFKGQSSGLPSSAGPMADRNNLNHKPKPKNREQRQIEKFKMKQHHLLQQLQIQQQQGRMQAMQIQKHQEQIVELLRLQQGQPQSNVGSRANHVQNNWGSDLPSASMMNSFSSDDADRNGHNVDLDIASITSTIHNTTLSVLDSTDANYSGFDESPFSSTYGGGKSTSARSFGGADAAVFVPDDDVSTSSISVPSSSYDGIPVSSSASISASSFPSNRSSLTNLDENRNEHVDWSVEQDGTVTRNNSTSSNDATNYSFVKW